MDVVIRCNSNVAEGVIIVDITNTVVQLLLLEVEFFLGTATVVFVAVIIVNIGDVF